jgi:hypothetical protein
MVGHDLSRAFQSFDSLIAYGGEELEQLVERYQELFPPEIEIAFEMIVAGWSAEQNAPEAYVIYAVDDAYTPADMTAEERTQLPEPFKFCRLPNAIYGPRITDEDMLRSGLPGIDVNDAPENAVDLMRHAIEVQRHHVPDVIEEGEGTHFVGGFVQLTTVTPNGITQRVLDRWPDEIGETIKPGPIDWPKWRAERASRRVAAALAQAPGGLSRLQRERMEKKARKGTLRAAS